LQLMLVSTHLDVETQIESENNFSGSMNFRMWSFAILFIFCWAINLLKTTFENSLTLKNKTVSTPRVQLMLQLVLPFELVEALRVRASQCNLSEINTKNLGSALNNAIRRKSTTLTILEQGGGDKLPRGLA
jgi:hypothetical protein